MYPPKASIRSLIRDAKVPCGHVPTRLIAEMFIYADKATYFLSRLGKLQGA